MGRSGRVGSALARVWQGRLPDRTVLTQARHGQCDFQWDPLRDGPASLVAFAAKQGGVSAIMAFVGATPATGGQMSETATLGRAILEGARHAGVPRVLLASSSAVYGPGENLSEASLLGGDSVYAKAKQELEAVAAERRSTELEICTLRIGNVAGTDALLGGKGPVRVIDQYADGSGPVRSYIGPVTLAHVVARLATHSGALPEVLNVAAVPAVAMSALADARGLSWSWKPAPPASLHTQRITLDCRRLSAIVGADVLKTSAAALVSELDHLK